MHKRILLLLLLLFLLPQTVHADVAWSAPDSFTALHPEDCTALPALQREYIALCDHYSYESPLDPTSLKSFIEQGSPLHLRWRYTDVFGHEWGLLYLHNGRHTSWVPMDALQPIYSAADYLTDHMYAVAPYSGEMDHLLPPKEQLDEYLAFHERNGGDSRRGEAPADALFDFPHYTGWRFPDSPDGYAWMWSAHLVPQYTLTDESGTVWVYTTHRYEPESSCWINVSSPNAQPDPSSPDLPPKAVEAPTHLPVPGQARLLRVGLDPRLAPVLPAAAAVLGVVLLSAVFLVLFLRKRRS